MGQDWLLAMSIQDVPRRPGRVPAEAHAKGYFARVVDEYLQIGITTPRREQEAISIHADRSVLPCRPRFCLVDRLKAVAYGVEVVALQLAQVIAHTKQGYGKLSLDTALGSPHRDNELLISRRVLDIESLTICIETYV